MVQSCFDLDALGVLSRALSTQNTANNAADDDNFEAIEKSVRRYLVSQRSIVKPLDTLPDQIDGLRILNYEIKFVEINSKMTMKNVRKLSNRFCL